MTKTKKMIQQNNELRERLEPDNKEYYKKLLEYVRFGNWFKDNNQAEEILLEVLQDLIAAQKVGLSAEEYFGKNPRKSADEILKTIDNKKFKGLRIFIIVLGVNLLISLIITIILKDASLSVFKWIFRVSYLSLGVYFLSKYLQRNVYSKHNTKMKERLFFLVCTFIIIIGLIIEQALLPDLWMIKISQELLLLGLFFVTVFTTWKISKLSKKEILAWSLTLLFLWILLGVRLLSYF